jgi:hypothetical protein
MIAAWTTKHGAVSPAKPPVFQPETAVFWAPALLVHLAWRAEYDPIPCTIVGTQVIVCLVAVITVLIALYNPVTANGTATVLCCFKVLLDSRVTVLLRHFPGIGKICLSVCNALVGRNSSCCFFRAPFCAAGCSTEQQ